MAKANKQADKDASTQQPAAAKKPAAKKPVAKKPAGAAAGGNQIAPPIDTSLAARAAAQMVANRDMLQGAGGGEKRESSSFKQLKQSLNKPALQGPGGLLHNSSNPMKSNLPIGGRKQVGHNQTFGADVNRTGVPRRTGG